MFLWSPSNKMVKLTAIVILVLCLIGVNKAQLITPFQICEMEQMKLKGLQGSDRLYDNQAMQDIRDYCLKHAYDNFGNQGTLG